MIKKVYPWWHPQYNLLGTHYGRLTAFFFLYMTEGLPHGFALVAMVTQMRRLNVSPDGVGTFAAVITLPWAFKWVMGPVVDLFYSVRWGRRRLWIVAMQIMMCVTLLAALPVDMAKELKLLSWLLIVHNIFAATQDVAIDALACGTLEEHERGSANGLMFAGTVTGSAIGGSGVLYLIGRGLSLNASFFVIICSVMMITLLVTLRLREPSLKDGELAEGVRLHHLALALHRYWREALTAFFGARSAVVGLAVALLPLGAYSLSLALCSNLSVELGMQDGLISKVGFIGAMITAGACVLGGFLSDRLGRRKVLMAAVIGTALPTLLLVGAMQRAGWIMPVPMDMADRPQPSLFLLNFYIWIGYLYALFQGVIYGTRTALFMDICIPAVAATQFTAYMAMMNLVNSYSAKWQCWIVERIGYPRTLMMDVALGMVCLFLIPFMTKHEQPREL